MNFRVTAEQARTIRRDVQLRFFDQDEFVNGAVIGKLVVAARNPERSRGKIEARARAQPDRLTPLLKVLPDIWVALCAIPPPPPSFVRQLVAIELYRW